MKNTVQLFVRFEDQDLMEVSKIFLEDIEKNFQMFKQEYQNYNKKLKKYLNQKDFVFEPEKLTKRSPLTIINAPWGTGKTFFIESFTKLFIDQKLKSEVFKKIIIIDAWKFSNSKDVPVEFAIELTNNLVSVQIDKKVKTETKKKIKKRLLRTIIPKSVSWGFNLGPVSLGVSHETPFLEENKDEAINEWKEIENNKEATIIFIDNLERLGSGSWDLLKSILKLQEFNNYLIVLPLNLDKLSNNKPVGGTEYPIDKYVDFNYYELKQDYTHFFSQKYQDQDFIVKLNHIFNGMVNEKKLSIRDVERSFKTNELFSKKNHYEILETIREKIWNPKDSFSFVYKEDIKEFLKLEEKRRKIYLLFAEKILERDEDGYFINISHYDLQQFKLKNNLISKWDYFSYGWRKLRGNSYPAIYAYDEYDYDKEKHKDISDNLQLYKLNFDYSKDYEYILKTFQRQFEIYTLSINRMEKENFDLSDEIKILEFEFKKLDDNDTNLEKELIQLMGSVITARDIQRQSFLESSLRSSEQKKYEIRNKIDDLKPKLNNHTSDFDFLKRSKDILLFNIKEIEKYIKELKEIDLKDKFLKNQKIEFINILKRKISDNEEDINYLFVEGTLLQKIDEKIN